MSWLDAAADIHDGYENSVPELFVPNVFSFATEGKELYYGAVRTPLEFWAAWRVNDGDDVSRLMGLTNVAAEMKQLLSPKTLLDILYNFTTYSTNKKRQRMKVVCRYQQYEGANLIVQRVVENKIKRGLIWHFQGSGKSLLILFAAQKMRKMAELKSPMNRRHPHCVKGQKYKLQKEKHIHSTAGNPVKTKGLIKINNVN